MKLLYNREFNDICDFYHYMGYIWGSETKIREEIEYLKKMFNNSDYNIMLYKIEKEFPPNKYAICLFRENNKFQMIIVKKQDKKNKKGCD